MNKYVLSVIALFALTLSGCGNEGTTTGNPVVTIEFDSYTPFSSKVKVLAVSDLKMCFKRIRFKPFSSDPGGENIDISIGEVDILNSGTSVTSIQVPSGAYRRVEFDLYDGCPSGKSLQVTNSSGSFSTNDTITIKFDGHFIAQGIGTTLTLGIQSIVDQLDTATADGDLKTLAESVSGTY